MANTLDKKITRHIEWASFGVATAVGSLGMLAYSLASGDTASTDIGLEVMGGVSGGLIATDQSLKAIVTAIRSRSITTNEQESLESSLAS